MERMNIFEKREEPIKVAEMLITASCECEPNQSQRSLGITDKYSLPVYDIYDLKEIAQYLLVYCENHGEQNEQR